MNGDRAGVFEDDLSDFQPRPAARPEEVRRLAEGAGFRSRDPQPVSQGQMLAAERREPRRYRTGRNQQFNIKARPEAIESFYAIADRQGWVLGETFERAISALLRELEEGNQTATK